MFLASAKISSTVLRETILTHPTVADRVFALAGVLAGCAYAARCSLLMGLVAFIQAKSDLYSYLKFAYLAVFD
jgi:hypothetical protein